MDSDFIEKPFYTVEELHKFRKHLAGKKVALKAKVYKVSVDIMKKDWVHLGDGSGKESALTDDIVFTTAHAELKAGDHVIAHGTITRITSYNVCYTKLLRLVAQDVCPGFQAMISGDVG